MRFRVILAILLISLTVISCSPNRNREGERISDRDYRQGTKGLELEFMRNAPPDMVYSGDDMNLIVEIRNLGAYPTTDSFDGRLEVYGYDEKVFQGERWNGGPFISPTLQGRSQFSPEGGRENKEFHVDKVTTPFGSEAFKQRIIVAACYKYKTIAQPLVCIDPEPQSVFDESKVCTVDRNGKTYALGSQGAPVAVTRVEEEISSSNINFSIEIKNVGRGKVVDENVRKECPLGLDFNDVDRVMASVKLPYDSSPKCQPKGDYTDPIRLDESEIGTIFCTFKKPPSKSAFETVLQITLDYRYVDEVYKDIEVINIDR